MRILVTGGHGFVGSHVVACLLERGHRVRCLTRRPAPPAFPGSTAVEWVAGDLRARLGLGAALRGCAGVVHLAGLTRSLTPRQMHETNARGTARLLCAARDAGLAGRFVLCSSLAAVGPAPDGRPLTEAAPARPLGWYGESKRAAERLVLARPWPFPVAVLRPPAVYGERDRDFLTLFRAVAQGLALLPGDPADRLSLVHAADLARAFACALEGDLEAPGPFFVAHPRVVTLAEVLAAAEAAVGRRARRLRVPHGALGLLGRLVDLGSQVSGRASLLGSQRLREVGARHWVCTPGRFERLTGWRAAVDLEEGFRRTAAWYRAQGLLAG